MMNPIYDKTAKGREEITTRKYHLAPRLRTLLLLIDGKQTAEEVLKKVAGIGVTQEQVAELLNDGFIQAIAAQSPAPAAQQAEPAIAQESAPPPAMTSAASILPEGQNQFQAIYQFYNETIKSTIGLRGYALQLKVERAASVEDFRELRRPYLEAVQKAKGNEMARSLGARLDELLYLGNPPANNTILGTME